MSVPTTIKERIRAVLLLTPRGADIHDFMNSYEELSNDQLQYGKYGFSSMLKLLKSIPDVATVCGDRVIGIDCGTARITRDILRQMKPHKNTLKRLQKHGRSYKVKDFSFSKAWFLNGPLARFRKERMPHSSQQTRLLQNSQFVTSTDSNGTNTLIQPVSSNFLHATTYLKCYHLCPMHESNVRGIFVDVLDRYIVLKNSCPSLTILCNELRRQMNSISHVSCEISSEQWHCGNLVIVHHENEWKRGVLLDTYLDPTIYSKNDGKRICRIYLLDHGSVVRSASEEVVVLTAVEYFWVAQVPPKYLLVALNNVVCLDSPYSSPLDGTSSLLHRQFRNYQRQRVNCTLISCYEDGILPHIYVASSFILLMEESDLCECFPQRQGAYVQEYGPVEQTWQYEPHWACSTDELSVQICEPLEWWPCRENNLIKSNREIICVDVKELESHMKIVMVMMQIRINELHHRLSEFMTLLSQSARRPSKIITGCVYLLSSRFSWLRVRILEVVSERLIGKVIYKVKLLDFPVNRYQTVSSENIFEYKVDPTMTSSCARGYSLCPPYFCRAFPVIVPEESSVSEYIEHFIGCSSLTAKRFGLGYLLNDC